VYAAGIRQCVMPFPSEERYRGGGEAAAVRGHRGNVGALSGPPACRGGSGGRLKSLELLIARNPDPESRLPYLLLLPLAGGMVFRISDGRRTGAVDELAPRPRVPCCVGRSSPSIASNVGLIRLSRSQTSLALRAGASRNSIRTAKRASCGLTPVVATADWTASWNGFVRADE
jgi:hypothetical protein